VRRQAVKARAAQSKTARAALDSLGAPAG
jgi:hypothetical protein